LEEALNFGINIGPLLLQYGNDLTVQIQITRDCGGSGVVCAGFTYCDFNNGDCKKRNMVLLFSVS